MASTAVEEADDCAAEEDLVLAAPAELDVELDVEDAEDAVVEVDETPVGVEAMMDELATAEEGASGGGGAEEVSSAGAGAGAGGDDYWSSSQL